MRDCFSKRWKNKYMQSLQTRSKWQLAKSNLCVGDFVHIMSELRRPSHWPLARVPKVHPGTTGLVRTATLGTASSVLDRPIAKLIFLSIVDHNVSADMLRRAEWSGANNEEKSPRNNAPWVSNFSRQTRSSFCLLSCIHCLLSAQRSSNFKLLPSVFLQVRCARSTSL